jgi:quercetin dioxygenase-like cupin family protein
MNLNKEFQKISDYFSPLIIGEVNDVYIKLAKIKGDAIPWHDHKNEDEMFLVIQGSLHMEVEGQEPFVLQEKDFYIVKKGIKHRIYAEEECQILLIENKSTAHTGDVQSPITKSIEQQKQAQ